MPLSRAVSSRLSCQACRTSIVRSFISPATTNGLIAPRASWTFSATAPSLAHCFTSTSIRRQQRNDLPPTDIDPGFNILESPNRDAVSKSAPYSQTVPDEVEQNPVDEPIPADEASQPREASLQESQASPQPASQPAPIPWYLRPQHLPSRSELPTSQSSREALPDLPPNPPPLLQTLLEYISITAGLDDLLLLDLRHLDPPPALGPKLIMIIGTARSEKHLHVSADRFSRYLRREHNLRPNPAGLLGRNELKIKLRRKAKRMKMLANVGGREPEGNIDDGIRTGWICCTVGKIEAHPEDTEMPGLGGVRDDFVGFRDVKPGVNVVVQMFTEEKRAEIDLETLWGGVLRTHERKEAVAEEKLREIDGEDVIGGVVEEESVPETPVAQAPGYPVSRPPSDPFPRDALPSQQWDRPMPNRGDIFPPASNRGTARQVRRLHTVGF